ncbi:MAG: hypothetical protein ABL909_07885 [Sphingopyxis sp.]
MKAELNRRTLLGSAAAIAALGPSAASAQSLRDIAARLPQIGQQIGLPGSVNELVQTVESIVGMEREAQALRLPLSLLSVASTRQLPVDQASLYRLALPRLVALIDRAETHRPALAEQAGALLARLHSGQHDVPQAWQSGTMDASGGALQLGDIGTPEVDDARIDLPPLSLPEPGPIILQPSSPPTTIRSHNFDRLQGEYAELYALARLLPDREDEARWHLTMMRGSRARYEAVSRVTNVPWYFVAAVHGLEASFNFRGHLHNGDFPLTARTRQVPAGRPATWLPPSGWEASAIDALRLMGFAGQSDWSLTRTLYRLEAYNGFGYRTRGVPTPYLWSFTDQYDRGKFIADGRWNPLARSQQCGAAAMLKIAQEAGEIQLA